MDGVAFIWGSINILLGVLEKLIFYNFYRLSRTIVLEQG
jgi:hypothetical protein